MTATVATPLGQLRRRFQAQLFDGMPEQIQRLTWSAERIAEHQRDQLRGLLAHAIEHSPFHARRLSGIDPQTFDLADLGGLPVMTKADLMGEFDDVLTDRRFSRTLVEEALAATTSAPVPLLDEYLCLASGGSSGHRGVYVADVNGIVSVISSALRPMMARFTGAGGPPPGGVTIGMVAAASAVHSTGSPPALLAGSPVQFIGVPVTLPLPEIVERLNALQPNALFGYPSMLARLAREQEADRLRIAPIGITSTSETLLPEQRSAIGRAFAAPLVNVFGSTEGLFGSTAPDDPVFVFSSDVCIVELVDERNRPVLPGTPSARILVTNLANRAQPLIRYEMNDRFVRQPDAADHGHLRATVDGRSDEIFVYGDIDIHPLVVRSVMVKTPSIVDYLIRQTERGINAIIHADQDVDVDAVHARLQAALAGAGLADPQVTIMAVPTLTRNQQTGKLKRFVPLR